MLCNVEVVSKLSKIFSWLFYYIKQDRASSYVIVQLLRCFQDICNKLYNNFL